MEPKRTIAFLSLTLMLGGGTVLGSTALVPPGTGTLPTFDYNGDGFADILIGADEQDDPSTDSGAVYLFLGPLPRTTTTISAADADVTFVGTQAGALFGQTLGSVQDFNGDGLDDVVVGASWIERGTDPFVGEAYVFFGSASPAPVVDDVDADLIITGEAAHDFLGFGVSGARDLDRDGLGDLVIGAPGNDRGASNAGAAYVFFGSTTYTSPVTVSAGDADVILLGEASGDEFGVAVSDVGDFNGDGRNDLAVSASFNESQGAVYIFFGPVKSGAGSARLAAEAEIKLRPDVPDELFGADVAAAGDIDCDGRGDLLVGAPGSDVGASNAGAVYLFAGALDPSTVLVTPRTKVVGSRPGARFGSSVAGPGDVDGDGLHDILVGSRSDDEFGPGAGKASVFMNPSLQPGATIPAGVARIVLFGDDFSRLGTSVSPIGDVDDDGRNDLFVGAPGDTNAGGIRAGGAFVFFSRGSSRVPLGTADADLTFVGATSSEGLGSALSN